MRNPRWMRQAVRSSVDHAAEFKRLTELAERNEKNADRIEALNGTTETVEAYRAAARRQRESADTHKES